MTGSSQGGINAQRCNMDGGQIKNLDFMDNGNKNYSGLRV